MLVNNFIEVSEEIVILKPIHQFSMEMQVFRSDSPDIGNPAVANSEVPTISSVIRRC